MVLKFAQVRARTWPCSDPLWSYQYCWPSAFVPEVVETADKFLAKEHCNATVVRFKYTIMWAFTATKWRVSINICYVFTPVWHHELGFKQGIMDLQMEDTGIKKKTITIAPGAQSGELEGCVVALSQKRWRSSFRRHPKTLPQQRFNLCPWKAFRMHGLHLSPEDTGRRKKFKVRNPLNKKSLYGSFKVLRLPHGL